MAIKGLQWKRCRPFSFAAGLPRKNEERAQATALADFLMASDMIGKPLGSGTTA